MHVICEDNLDNSGLTQSGKCPSSKLQVLPNPILSAYGTARYQPRERGSIELESHLRQVRQSSCPFYNVHGHHAYSESTHRWNGG